MLPGALERPGLVGPSNETVEEIFGPLGGSRNDRVDRPLWRAIDEKNVGPFGELNDEEEEVGPLGELRDDEDVGPLGELRDEEEVGSFGESRDEDQDSLRQDLEEEEEKDSLRQDLEEEEEKDSLRQDLEEEEEKEVASSEGDMNELMQLAAKSVGMMSGALADTGASSTHATTTLPTELRAPLTTSSPPLASTPSTPSRKRARDSDHDAYDEESSSQRKRMRMDDILGIVRGGASAAIAPQNVGPAMTPVIQQSRKRARSSEDESENGITKRRGKRLRLYLRKKEIPADDEEYIAAGPADVTENDNSAIDYQDASSSETQEAFMVENPPTDIQSHKKPSVGDETSENDEAEDREEISANENAPPAEVEWDTAHGINSTCANIPIPDKGVRDVTGQERQLHLPTSTGLPDRPWTEEEKEDLRVYIQDYGIEDWERLSQSTNRPEDDLKDMYSEVIKARNIQAGRDELAGLPQGYPNLAAPEESAPEEQAQVQVEPRKLRSLDLIGKSKKNKLGDLTYDVKATSFPKIARDGGMVDAKGNVLLGVMGDIPRVTQRREQKPKQEVPESLAPAENSIYNARSEAEADESDSEIEEGEIDESAERSEPAPSLERVGKRKSSLNSNVKEEEEDPEVKQEDSDLEQGLPTPATAAAKTHSTKGPLGPKFAGVPKLSGSSRRGVPRKAAGPRKWSAE